MEKIYTSAVIEFQEGWDILQNSYPNEYQELLDFLNEARSTTDGNFEPSKPTIFNSLSEFVTKGKWSVPSDVDNVKLFDNTIFKNGLEIRFGFLYDQNVFSWIHTNRSAKPKLKVLFVEMEDETVSPLGGGIFHESDLILITKIEHSLSITPFAICILRLSNSITTSPKKITKLLAEKKDSDIMTKVLVFPPELYEAGRGILTYFGTYLEEQYGNQKATVTIRQDDRNKTLTMTVESENGTKEVIEKAYEEFSLIISGQEPPEKFVSKDNVILGLRSELRLRGPDTRMLRIQNYFWNVTWRT